MNIKIVKILSAALEL